MPWERCQKKFLGDDFAAAANFSKSALLGYKISLIKAFFQRFKLYYPSLVLRPSQLSQISEIINLLSSLETANLRRLSHWKDFDSVLQAEMHTCNCMYTRLLKRSGK